MADSQGPDVFITSYALNKLEFYIDAAPKEISGYGVAELIDSNSILVSDVFTFHQESDATGTEIEPEELAQGIIELVTVGNIDPEGIKVWWHSHVNMQSTFSGTDTNTMDNNPNFKDAPFFVSIVGNKKGEYNVRVDQYNPVRFYKDGQSLYIWETRGIDYCAASQCDSPVHIDEDKKASKYCQNHHALHEAIKAEVKEKVQEPVRVYKYAGAYSEGYKPGIPPYDRSAHYCRANGCWVRLPTEKDYCWQHAEKPANEKYLENVVNYSKGSDSEIYVACDISDCNTYCDALESYVDGVVLCDEHQQDLDMFEAMYGDVASEKPELIIELLEYYTGIKNAGALSPQADAILEANADDAFAPIDEEDGGSKFSKLYEAF
jgi:hypothetical protein